MATIRKRDGRWRVQVRKRGNPPQSKSFESRAQAHAWARQVEAQIDRGVFVDTSRAERTTMTELLDRYLREVTPAKASARREALRIALLKRHFGHWSVARLRPEQIAAFRDARVARTGRRHRA